MSNYGEPFLNRQLLPILAYAHSKGVATTLQNGVNLNDVMEETLEALVKYGLRDMTCSIEIYRTEFPRLMWQFVVFGHNEHEISAARELAKKLGMSFFAKLSWDPDFSPVRERKLVAAETGAGAATRAEYNERQAEPYMGGICHQLWDRPQINWDGKILGCCRNFWGDFGGNVSRDGLPSSFNTEKMTYAREMLIARAAG